jgi:hypothetical protein
VAWESCVELKRNFLFNREGMMKTVVRVPLFLALMVVPLVIASCATVGDRKTEPVGSPPVITDSFAATEVSHGDVWKVYVKANDPDGDMRYLAYSIQISGQGGHTNRVGVRKGDRAELLGYLNIFFPPARDAWGEWADLTMTLYIQDSQGNTSEKVTVTTALSRGIKQASPPAPFDIEGLKALGHIWVELPRLPTGGY